MYVHYSVMSGLVKEEKKQRDLKSNHKAVTIYMYVRDLESTN